MITDKKNQVSFGNELYRTPSAEEAVKRHSAARMSRRPHTHAVVRTTPRPNSPTWHTLGHPKNVNADPRRHLTVEFWEGDNYVTTQHVLEPDQYPTTPHWGSSGQTQDYQSHDRQPSGYQPTTSQAKNHYSQNSQGLNYQGYGYQGRNYSSTSYPQNNSGSPFRQTPNCNGLGQEVQPNQGQNSRSQNWRNYNYSGYQK